MTGKVETSRSVSCRTSVDGCRANVVPVWPEVGLAENISTPPTTAQTAVALSGHDGDEDPLAEQLLADLYAIFHDPATAFEHPERDRLPTVRVVELLVALDARPWATYNTKTGKPVTQYQVARLLRRFGVRPIKARIDAKATNCYHRSDLEPAWRRYTPGVQVGTSEQTNETGPESMISGRNGSTTRSDLKSAISSIDTGPVPAFRPEAPSGARERGEL
jgi:hypothetical protein